MRAFLFGYPLSTHIRTCIYQAELILIYMVVYWPIYWSDFPIPLVRIRVCLLFCNDKDCYVLCR